MHACNVIVLSFPGNPYPSVPGVEKLFELLEEGYRMEKPSGCSDEIYAVMLQCWRFQSKSRPSFSELVQTFDQILSQISNTEYVIMSPPKSDQPSIETNLPET